MTATTDPTVARRADAVAPEVVRTVWTLLIGGTAAASAAYALVAPRSSTGPSPVFASVAPGAVRALQLVVALAVVAAAAGAALLALPVLRTPRRGAMTALGLAGLGAAVLVSGWFNGTKLSLGLLALPAVAVAVWWFPHPPIAHLERVVRGSLRGIVWSSLAAGVLAPTWGTERLYTASHIGLHSRLVGLTPHANALGPLAVLLVALEAARAKLVSLPVALAASAVLWTQSKTSWVAAALVGLLWALQRAGARRAGRALLALVAAGVVTVTGVVAITLLAPGRATAKGNDSAETFTGRTAIWEATLEVWQPVPVLGVGTRLWDDAMDRRFAHRIGFTAGHAHNQLIQTLGEAGLVGEAALLVALVGLCGLCALADEPTAGVAVAGGLVLVVTCFSEVPVRSVPFSTNFVLLLVVYALAMVGANAPAVRRAG